MILLSLRKKQLRDLGKHGNQIRLLSLLMEMRFNPLDEFEKKFAEAYLMKMATSNLPEYGFLTEARKVTEEVTEPVPEDIDPFA